MKLKAFNVSVTIGGVDKYAGKSISRTRRSAKRKVFARLSIRHPYLTLDQFKIIS
jgi:hypothetical protein